MRDVEMKSGVNRIQEIRNAVSAAHREGLLDGRLEEPMTVGVVPAFKTACWSWSGGVHRVFVGGLVLERALPGLGGKELAAYVGRYVHHERSHALFTTRDNEAVGRWLKAHKVPFALFNMVEDARVEARYRETSEDGFTFGWLQFEPMPSQRRPVGPAAGVAIFDWAFNGLVQGEGNVSCLGGVDDYERAHVDNAITWYKEAVAAKDSCGAVEVAEGILSAYPELSGMGSRCALETGMSMSGAEGRKKLKEFEEGAEDKAATEQDQQDDGEDGGKRGGRIGDGLDLLAEGRTISVNSRRVSALAKKLQELRGLARRSRVLSRRPGKRVSVRHAMRGRAKWAERARGGVAPRLTRLLLVVDVSGSMDGDPLEDAAHLIAALSTCAEEGMVQGDVVLSTTSDSEAGAWMRLSLPWQEDEIARLVTHDLEGLDATLSAHELQMMDADETYVFTDANISGRKIRHAEYARRGLRVTGLYCNSGRNDLRAVEAKMGEHFERYVVRSSVEALVDAIVAL